MGKKKNKKVYWVVGIVALIILVFLIGIDMIKCELKGGDWRTLGPVGCCADNKYWLSEKLSCEESGGEWILPKFVGATIKDGMCHCYSPKEWLCPIGYPCAICSCQYLGPEFEDMGEGRWKQTDSSCTLGPFYKCQRICYDVKSELWQNCAEKLSDKIEKVNNQRMICSPYGGMLSEEDCGAVYMWKG